jgi:gas vesicle protein
MPRRDWDDDEQIIFVEENDSSGLSAFLLGAAIGAGLALIFAPQTGAETRQSIRRGAQKAGEATKRAGVKVGEKVTDALTQAKAELESRIDSAKSTLDLKRVQVSRAVDAGREAARVAREDLERRMAEQRASDASRIREHDNGAA